MSTADVGGSNSEQVQLNTQMDHPRPAQKRATVDSAKRGNYIKAEERTSTESNPLITSPTNPRFTLQRATTVMFQPPKPVGRAPGFVGSLLAATKASWLNLMLVFIPISWALHFALPSSYHNKDTLVFVFSFLAIIPLAKLLAFATDEISKRVGQTLAGLINATLGNAVELIVAIIALTKCELSIVQSSLVGSILSNLLLVLGMCFFAGGLKFSEQGFGLSATQLNSSLLTISVIAVLLPAAFHFFVAGDSPIERADILHVSHGVAIILLFIYCAYLVFQLYSHTVLFEDNSSDVFRSTKYDLKKKKKEKTGNEINGLGDDHTASHDEEQGNAATDDCADEEKPEMHFLAALSLLAIVTVLVAVTAEWLVDSISGLTSSGKINAEFVGLILLPIVGNAAEHVTAVTVSVKDKLNLSLGVAVGSSIQISLFVIPFIVVLGWILGKPMSFLFDPYESIALFLSVLTVNYVVQDGKSNWLEGMILMCLYVILALTFWFYPGTAAEFTCK